MQHYSSLEGLDLHAAWVTIGSFDGVHLGHQAIIKRMTAAAHKNNEPAVVVTFFPHPLVIVRGNHGISYLTTPEERAGLLGSLGIDFVITLPFTKELASLSADQFMEMLSKHLGLKSLWVGHDFALGHGRQGNIAVLEEIGIQLHFSIEEVSAVAIEGKLASSSKIRQLLARGDVAQVSRLLGRRYSIPGQVVHGNQRGRQIGYPTINLDIWPHRALPANGIYATWVQITDKRFMGATNIGLRPTFDSQNPKVHIETYILDFDQDLYGRTVSIEFEKFLRPEERFNSVDQLKEQIDKDVELTREVLSHAI
jgi:riboflavin kinase / FMN adenylyltransferase